MHECVLSIHERLRAKCTCTRAKYTERLGHGLEDGTEINKTRAFYKMDGTEHSKTLAFYKTDGTEHNKTRAFYKTDGTEHNKTRAFYKTDGT